MKKITKLFVFLFAIFILAPGVYFFTSPVNAQSIAPLQFWDETSYDLLYRTCNNNYIYFWKDDTLEEEALIDCVCYTDGFLYEEVEYAQFWEDLPASLGDTGKFVYASSTDYNNCSGSSATYATCIASGGFISEQNWTYQIEDTSLPSYLSLSPASSTDMLATAGVLFSDLWQYIAIIAGIPLAFFIINMVQKLVLVKEKTKKGR